MSGPPAPSAPPQSRAKTVFLQIVTGLTTLMGFVLGAAWLYSQFTLPGCDGSRIRQTLTSLFRNNGISTISGYEPARETARTGDEVSCAVIANLPDGGRLDVTYQITKTGFGTDQIRASWRRL
jgi:hypothetical protein